MQYMKVFMLVCLLFPLAGIQPITMAGNMTDILAQQVSLQQVLEVQIFQAGFVGVSGEIWKIEPSGQWYMAEFVNSQVHQPHRSGQLTDDQLRDLERVLSEQDFNTLPDQFGQDPEVNPQTITIRFGAVEKSLMLNAGEDLDAIFLVPSQSKDLGRFRTVYHAIETLLH
jgi:hypothetical protein